MDWKKLRDSRRKATHGGPFTFGGSSWVPEKYLLVDTETGDVWGYSVDYDGRVHVQRRGADEVIAALAGEPGQSGYRPQPDLPA